MMSGRSSMVGTLLVAALFLVACGKEPLDPPAEQVILGTAKSMPVVNNVDGSANDNSSASPRGSVDGNNDPISDDGDDVGDGERNRKRRPN